MPRFIRSCAVSLLVLLSACQNPPEVSKYTAPRFTQAQPFGIDVASMEVIAEYQSPMQKPHVEHLFPVTPADSVRIWAKDRLRTVGGEGRLEVIIKDASVKEVELPRTQGIKGAFTKDQSERYDARVEVQLRIYRGSGVSVADVEATATRSQTIAENASPAERDRLFWEMNNQLMKDLDRELDRNISRYFTSYLQYAGPNR